MQRDVCLHGTMQYFYIRTVQTPKCTNCDDFLSFSTRKGKGLKVSWGTEETLGFFGRWNPFNSRVPYTIFTSHILVRKGAVNNPQMTIENVVPELERAIQDLRRAANTEQSPPGGEAEGATAAEPTEFQVKNEDILFTTYFGLSASIYNQSSLGFFRRRGAVNW